jgi:hypothetical protein
MSKIYSPKKWVTAGTIGGIVGGVVMLVPMMLMMSMMNLPADLFPMLIGMAMNQMQQSASISGIGVHLVTSLIIGVIFGAVISSSKLSVTSFKKGIPLGIGAGIISFVVLFLPMSMEVFPPTMMQLMQMMNPEASQEMIMQQLQGMQPMVLVGSFVSHIIYGIVLGVVSSAILRKSKNKAYNFDSVEEVFDEGK